MPRLLILLVAAIMGVMICGEASAAESRVRVRGLVRDSLTHDPVPFAAVLLKGADAGGLTDENGIFEIYTAQPFSEYVVTAVGYAPKHYPVQRGGTMAVIGMNPEGLALDEVTVGSKKTRYSKKNNPAVEFMKAIKSQGDATDPRSRAFYGYRKYERIALGLNDFHPDANEGLMKQFPFLSEHVDTSEITLKPVLTLSTREKLSEMKFRREPRSAKELVTGLRSAGVDEIADTESMRRFFEDVMREVDLYDDDIPLMQNRFVSPLSRLAPDFYRFYLTDTVTVGADTCVVLSFTPRNRQSFGFSGRIYVVKDDPDMFVRRVAMRVPRSVNLNYIKDLRIDQLYAKAENGARLKLSDDLAFEARLMPGTPEIYAERRTSYSDHDFDAPADTAIFDTTGDEIIETEAYNRPQSFWDRSRSENDRMQGGSTATLMERLRSNKLYYWGEQVVRVLANGYIPTGRESRFDIGPVNTMISYNELEGTRLRLGGMTTAHLNRHLFARGYAAYGMKDHRWKYGADLEYSFKPKKYHANEFPIHSVAAGYTSDVDKLGQHYMFTNPDNMFLSLTRHANRQITYHRVARLRYTMELPSHFSLTARMEWERQEASPFIAFTDGYGVSARHYDETTLTVQLRYAPGETFYQGRTHRYPINMDAPVVMLSHTFGPKGLPGNRFAVNITEASLIKRFWFSAWGYADIILKGAHVWSRSAFPQLLIPNANLSYTVQPESFALMNPMEFINDSYASWDLTYWANGAIFNYIPLLNRLKLREVFSFRGLWGHLSDRNNPECDPALFRFPSTAHTRMMSDTPYMEVAVGLDNILSVLRVDYVWRLTYRDTPGCSRSGLQLGFHFTF